MAIRGWCSVVVLLETMVSVFVLSTGFMQVNVRIVNFRNTVLNFGDNVFDILTPWFVFRGGCKLEMNLPRKSGFLHLLFVCGPGIRDGSREEFLVTSFEIDYLILVPFLDGSNGFFVFRNNAFGLLAEEILNDADVVLEITYNPASGFGPEVADVFCAIRIHCFCAPPNAGMRIRIRSGRRRNRTRRFGGRARGYCGGSVLAVGTVSRQFDRVLLSGEEAAFRFRRHD